MVIIWVADAVPVQIYLSTGVGKLDNLTFVVLGRSVHEHVDVAFDQDLAYQPVDLRLGEGDFNELCRVVRIQ